MKCIFGAGVASKETNPNANMCLALKSLRTSPNMHILEKR